MRIVPENTYESRYRPLTHNFYGPGKHMYELAHTYAPAALVEIAFHDNAADAEWIVNNIEAIGVVIAKGVLKYFDVPYQEEDSNLDSELKLLQKAGIINSPEYWKENAVKGKNVAGEYAAILIKRVAALLNEQNGKKP